MQAQDIIRTCEAASLHQKIQGFVVMLVHSS